MFMNVVDRRRLLAGAASGALIAFSGVAFAAAPVFRPERFGAKGDGRTDDSEAFARLSDAVNAAGGGIVELRRRTYLVGTQTPGMDLTMGARLLLFERCTRPVVVRGNGATLRCAPGQRYGMFLPDGSPVPEIVPKGIVGMVRPYAAMIEARFCSGGLLIQDIELDGNSGKLVVGGKRGDKGWQIGCAGVVLRNNSGPEQIVNVWSHHHPHDGFYVDGPREPTPGVKRHFVNLRADANGRQGMSLVGGRDYRIERSSFTRTGRGAVTSPPGAGLDIEAQRKKAIRNLTFVDCKFMDNRGAAMVADSGDSADVSFTNCTFVGTDNWAAWPKKPGFRFEGCTLVGSVVRTFSDPDPARATRFIDCLFTDDPTLSPTGKVVFQKSRASVLASGVLLDRCRLVMVGDGVLPTSNGTIYRDCTMSQRSSKVAALRGRFEGRNVIKGAVALKNSVVVGDTVLNGNTVPKTDLAPQPSSPS
jgi:hypothetical protein